MIEIKVDKLDDGVNGKIVSSEVLRILRRLVATPALTIQNECNRVATLRRERWTNRDQNAMMIEEGLPNISYRQGIRELDPPFLLKSPLVIHVEIYDCRVDELNPKYKDNREAAAGVPSGGDPMNPRLMIFLPTLEVQNSNITWTHRPGTLFSSVVIHEFLHLYGETKEHNPGVVDGVIRHTDIATEAIRNLLGDL